jgi:UDP:flavonoid glycosyltransferase YjiC (YdhE family)
VRVLGACSLGGAGHLQPLFPLLDAARARGDDTLVVAPLGLAPLVERTPHPFVAGGEPPESSIAPIREALPVLLPEQASILGNRELFARLATDAMLPTMARVFDEWRPDLVLREPCEYASAVIAAARGIPSAQVAISLARAEWGSIEVAADVLESHRAGLVHELREAPYVSAFPGSLDPSPFPDTRRVRTRPPRAPAPLPDWWSGSSAPLVYVTFGSVLPRMTFAASAFRSVLREMAGLDVRVLLTVGRLAPDTVEPLPANAHVEHWVEQSDVLAQVDLVVCHGGSGTVLGALAAGVPMVLLPHFGDQFPNATRIAASGAGVVVEAGWDEHGRRRRATEQALDRIAPSVAQVRNDPSFRAAAQRMARELQQLPVPESLLDELTARPGRAGGSR